MIEYGEMAAQFPDQVWDGTTGSRNDADRADQRPRLPDGIDWIQIALEMVATQEYVLALAEEIDVEDSRLAWLTRPTTAGQILIGTGGGAAAWSSGYNPTDWDAAYDWGDHADAGYLVAPAPTGSALPNGGQLLIGLAPGVALWFDSVPTGNKIYFGDSGESSISFDGTNTVFNSREVGTGNFAFGAGYLGIGTETPERQLDVIDADGTGVMRMGIWAGFSGTTQGSCAFGENFYTTGTQKFYYMNTHAYIGASGMVTRWSVAGSTIGLFSTGIGSTKDVEFTPAEAIMVTEANEVRIKTLMRSHDGIPTCFGSDKDARIYYNGTDLYIEPKYVGAGKLRIQGSVVLNDNTLQYFGSGEDARIWYNGTDLYIDPKYVGTGKLNIWGNVALRDSEKLLLGTGLDASVYYDGTNLIVNPKAVGTGILDILGTLQVDGYNAADATPGATADIAVAKVGGGTRTLSFKNGLYTGYTDS